MIYREINDRNHMRLRGQAGVYRVASELLLRGFNPSFPSVDCGADLIADGGVRVQVKCARLRYGKESYTASGAYFFHFGRNRTVSGSREVRRFSTRNFSETSDFLVLWGIEQSRFWVVPSALLDNRALIVLGPDVQWVDADVAEIKRLRAEGKLYEEISQIMGIPAQTISRRDRGIHAEQKYTLSAKVRTFENRWDLLQDFVASAVQAEVVTIE